VVGLQRGIVRVVDADPNWPNLFRAEAIRLSALIETAKLPPLAFEHIGSTAVPELVAKPIIDLMAGFSRGVSPKLYFARLIDAAYEHRGPQGVPDRELFVLGPEVQRTHHLNLVELRGQFWRDHLFFRDRLRGEPNVRNAYAALKKQLAAQHAEARGMYTEGKAAFVKYITRGGRLPPPPNQG